MKPHIHVDPRAPSALTRWVCYGQDGRTYSGRNPSLAFKNWRRHQPMDRKGGLRFGGSG